MGDILAGVSSTASAPMSAQREVNGPNIKEIWRASGEVFVVQYGVGRQPCRCAQINSLIEFSHAVSMQPTVSRLLQLKIYRTSTRSRCTCTRVHVQYKTRYEVYIRVQYFMYSANKKEVHTKDVPVHEKDQSKAKIQQRTYHT